MCAQDPSGLQENEGFMVFFFDGCGDCWFQCWAPDSVKIELLVVREVVGGYACHQRQRQREAHDREKDQLMVTRSQKPSLTKAVTNFQIL